MFVSIKNILSIYWCIFLAFCCQKKCMKFCMKSYKGIDKDHAAKHVKRFRKIYSEAFLVTIAVLILSYILAGLPKIIPWNKLIPTLLLAFPIYGTRNVSFLTMGGKSPSENMDMAFFKASYIIGIAWLAWDMFKGII